MTLIQKGGLVRRRGRLVFQVSEKKHQGLMPRGLSAATRQGLVVGEAGGVVVFVSGEEAKEVAVGNGAEGFCAVAVIAETAAGEDGRTKLAVFGFQTFECGEGNAVSAVEMVEGFKELGFALMVVRLRVAAAALRLHQRIGAYSFVCSHGGLLTRRLWLGRVRC